MAADHRDAVRRGGKRQQALIVFQQHDALFRHAQRNLTVGRVVDRRFDRRMVEQSGSKHRAEDPAHHGGKPVLRNGSGAQRIAQRLVEISHLVQRIGRFLVEALQCEINIVNTAPVGHHPAGKAPIAFEHAVQQMVVATGIFAIDQIVGTHHRAGPALLDRNLECQQIGFAGRRLPDHRIGPVAVGLLIVQGEMLDG